MKRHQDTLFQYASGGFGNIQLDLVNGNIIKKSQQESDVTLKQESLIYDFLSKQTNDRYFVKRIKSTYSEAGNPVSIILERCDCDLRFLLNQKAITPHMLDIISLQVLEGIAFLHSSSVIHCDLKPSNILIQFDTSGGFQVKLCDFGLSQIQTRDVRVNQPGPNREPSVAIKGTSGYLDPRIVIDKIPYCQLTDLWALAISLLVISGRYSHIDVLQTKQLKAIAHERKTPSSDVIKKFQEHVSLCFGDVRSINRVVIENLISADYTPSQSSCEVMERILLSLQKSMIPMNHVMSAYFDEAASLQQFPLFEYFKIRDSVRIYLVNRLLVISQDTEADAESIVLSGSGIFFTSPQFVEQYKQILIEYQERFGFTLKDVKMKKMEVPVLKNLKISDGVIQFYFKDSRYTLTPDTGEADVIVKQQFQIISKEQCRYIKPLHTSSTA